MIHQPSPPSRVKSAIYIQKHLKFTLDCELTDTNHVIIVTNDLVIMSSYFYASEDGLPKTVDPAILERFLTKYSDRKLIIMGDFNCRVSFGDSISSQRGISLHDFMLEKGLLLMNATSQGLHITLLPRF